MGFKSITICAANKEVGDYIKKMCALFFAKHFPKKSLDGIDVLVYDKKIEKYGVDFAEHIEAKKLKRYFNKAKVMCSDELSSKGGVLFIFAPKIVSKLAMNHALAGIGIITKQSQSIHELYIKLSSGESKPSGADKVRKWFCKRVEDSMKDEGLKWADILKTVNFEDILAECCGGVKELIPSEAAKNKVPEEYKEKFIEISEA